MANEINAANAAQTENAAAAAQNEVANLQAQLKAAKEALAKAKAAQKAANGRPIRLNRFEVHADTDPKGEALHKGDVHYCEEKFAIDAVKAGEHQELYVVYHTKDVENGSKWVVLQRIYKDENGCVVID